MHEKKLAESINKIGKISNPVSEKVKVQYEENPYPRWRYTNHIKGNRMKLHTAINSEILPNKIIFGFNGTYCKPK